MKKLDTSELGPVKLDTAPRVLRMRAPVVSRPNHADLHHDIAEYGEHPRDYDVILWRGVRFVKEQE